MYATFTLFNPKRNVFYDTNDEKMYDADSFEWTFDTSEYLETLVENNPEKFEGFKIVDC